MAGGSLYDLLFKDSSPIEYTRAISWLSQIAAGMCHLVRVVTVMTPSAS